MMKSRNFFRFATCQLSCYLLSCIGLLFYLIHYLISQDHIFRVQICASWEIFLLVLRTLNEYLHSKLDSGDVLHHSSFIVGTTIVVLIPQHQDFGYLLCHMQILHIPMSLWYIGCRRNSVSLSPPIRQLCRDFFPIVWSSSVTYRITIMLTAAGSSRGYLSKIIVLFTIVLGYLDVTWTKYFYGEIGVSAITPILVGIAIGLGLGIYSSYDLISATT